MAPTPTVQFTRHERYLINQLAQVKRKRLVQIYNAVKRQRRKIKAIFLGSHHSEIVELSDSEPDDDGVVFTSTAAAAVMVTSTATLTMPLQITDSIESELMPPTSHIASTSQQAIDQEGQHENQESNVQANTNKGFIKAHKKTTNGKRKRKVRLPAPVLVDEPQITLEEALAQVLNL